MDASLIPVKRNPGPTSPRGAMEQVHHPQPPATPAACLRLLAEQRAGMTLADDHPRPGDPPHHRAAHPAPPCTCGGHGGPVGKRYVLGAALIQLGTRALESVDAAHRRDPRAAGPLERDPGDRSPRRAARGTRPCSSRSATARTPFASPRGRGRWPTSTARRPGKVFLAFQVDDLASSSATRRSFAAPRTP